MKHFGQPYLQKIGRRQILSTEQHPANDFIQIAQTNKLPHGMIWRLSHHSSKIKSPNASRHCQWLPTSAQCLDSWAQYGGLIYALEGLNDASNIERTARLSAGIGAAMLTTAWGLIAGLPMMFAHNTLVQRSDAILAQCQSLAKQLSKRVNEIKCHAGCWGYIWSIMFGVREKNGDARSAFFALASLMMIFATDLLMVTNPQRWSQSCHYQAQRYLYTTHTGIVEKISVLATQTGFTVEMHVRKNDVLVSTGNTEIKS